MKFRLFLYGTSIYFLLALVISYIFIDVNILDVETNEVTGDFSHIFTNNFLVINSMIFMTPFTLGIQPIVFLSINAGYLGMYLNHLSIDVSRSLLLLPHGIIEIPLFILSSSLAYKILHDLIRFKKEKWIINLKYFIALQVFILVAAIIESFITPAIYNYFG